MEITREVQTTMQCIQGIYRKMPDLEKLEIRDLFAIAALNGIVSDCDGYYFTSHAETAYKYADAMLKARTQK